ncbi:MAG: hydroxyacid dehydrogenase [Clostridia bacterium]|nr:hydroxyacid dehydrogenase [Clostridia bacterium]
MTRLNERALDKRSALDAYPAYDAEAVRARLNAALGTFDRKIVVLDDDPTGVQTVHGVSVYTDWSMDSVRSGFDEQERIFFLLTNSRGFNAERTRRVHAGIARTIVEVSRKANRNFLLISRSDSTLRGHYPLETETLRAAVESEGLHIDGEIIIPFFLEGGRYTIGDVHYVSPGDTLTPAGQTEFALDHTFGYSSSNLCEWVAEKTAGAYPAGTVTSITLEELRACDYAGITAKLQRVKGFGKIVVNAIDYLDVAVFVTALIEAINHGKEFLFRSAAALTKVIGGIADRPLLTREDLVNTTNRNGGLIVVGSHVRRTTEQLERLRAAPDIVFVEFNQHLALDPPRFEAEQRRALAEVERHLRNGETVAFYTRRERLDLGAADKEEELRLSVRISDAVSGIVAGLSVRPNFIIAKGGITSSDVGTKGLGVRRALVMGQVLQGVPVWLTGPESKFPNLPYVIFPGNVGDENALLDTVMKVRPAQ